MSERDSIAAGRMYVRALLDSDGRACEPAHEAYAERLVDEHWTASDEQRAVVRVALNAYLDGYYQGVAAGQRDGLAMARDTRFAPPAEEAPPAA